MLVAESTVAIVCGASSWPHLDVASGPAFANSAAQIDHYLRREEHGLNLPPENALWLFDQPDVTSQYRRIMTFLTNRQEVLNKPQGKDLHILFFYIGHGDFLGPRGDYCLLLTDTMPPINAETSIRADALMGLLRSLSPASSRIIVLDSCFAAAAVASAQSSLESAVSTKVDAMVARASGDRGITFLCASNKEEFALLENPESRTYFNIALIEVLTAGDPHEPGSPMSLLQIGTLMRENLERQAATSPGQLIPMPEVHAPKQTSGNLSTVPLFPNFAESGVPAPKAPDIMPGSTRPLQACRTLKIDIHRISDIRTLSHEDVTPAVIEFQMSEPTIMNAKPTLQWLYDDIPALEAKFAAQMAVVRHEPGVWKWFFTELGLAHDSRSSHEFRASLIALLLAALHRSRRDERSQLKWFDSGEGCFRRSYHGIGGPAGMTPVTTDKDRAEHETKQMQMQMLAKFEQLKSRLDPRLVETTEAA